MSNFLDSLKLQTNKTTTENGAVSNISTLDPMLDFFSRAGAMRGDKEGAVKLFQKAYASDPLMAIKALFYLRDVRGGQGERDLFRACVKTLDVETQTQIVTYVPVYGRYDDLLSFATGSIINLIKMQLELDQKATKDGGQVSLMAKWLPSENTSSKHTKKMAEIIRKELGMKPSQYRKLLSSLRKHIVLLEHKMTKNEWDAIEYDKLPSQAHRKHVKAFKKHSEAKYTEYLGAVEKGEKKINTSTLFTYEVFDMVKEGKDDTANAMWKNLPDYTNGKNALVLADVSGSMQGRPMSISVSLALYFAERNKGPFNGYFMSFTDQSRLVQVMGNSLTEKLRNIERTDWDGSTNIESAFRVILQAAVSSNATIDDMPAVLYVISDMEFNQATEGEKTNLEFAKKMFESAGYKMPHVVFWNVDSRKDQVPATMFDNNVTLISGSSQSTFRYAVEGKTPLESMKDILNSERYSQIILDSNSN